MNKKERKVYYRKWYLLHINERRRIAREKKWLYKFGITGEQVREMKKSGCEKCGFKRALVIHHKDGNSKHAVKENLQVLCRNCHWIIHHPEEKTW